MYSPSNCDKKILHFLLIYHKNTLKLTQELITNNTNEDNTANESSK